MYDNPTGRVNLTISTKVLCYITLFHLHKIVCSGAVKYVHYMNMFIYNYTCINLINK